jgi:putative peptidoglycan binding protein
MREAAQFFFRSLAMSSLALLAVTAASPTAVARPKGIASGISHGDRNRGNRGDRDDRSFRSYSYYSLPYWWYARSRCRYFSDQSGPVYDESYWRDLAIKIQSELARRGYYHGQINGVIDLTCRQAIRAFQKARGLPQTGLVDPGVLKSLDLL